MKKLLLFIFACIATGAVFAQNSVRPLDLVKERQKVMSVETVSPFRTVETPSTHVRNSFEEFAEFRLEEPQIAALLTQDKEYIELTLPIENQQTIDLQLVEVQLFPGGENYVYTLPENKKVEVEVGKFYRGIVKGNERSVASFSVFDGEVSGFILQPGQENIVVGKLKETATHVSYRETPNYELNCGTEDDGISYTDEELFASPSDAQMNASARCTKLYQEIDYDVYKYNDRSVQETSNYMSAIMNNVSTLYANENINVGLTPYKVWTSSSPYYGSSAAAVLNTFKSEKSSIPGDLGQLVTFKASGGIAAGFNGLCNSNVDNSISVASIGRTYASYPTYSYTVMVITHEYGHLFGSRHTHACVWNGNSTAIDSCAGYVEGSCSEPGDASVGLIMSYCHNRPVGITFTAGFGNQSGNVVRNRYANASCLGSCSGGGGGGGGGGDSTAPTKPGTLSYSNLTSNSVELSWGSSYDANGVTGYEVYENGTKIGTVTSTSANVSDMRPSTSYRYKVRAVDAAGNASTFTNTVYLTTPSTGGGGGGGGGGSCASGKTEVKVNLTTDRYPTENSWEIRTKSGSLVASKSTFTKNAANDYTACLSDGCYVFTIKDTYGDGICCSYGNGSFSVVVDGKTIKSGSSFGSSASVDFCVGGGDPNPPGGGDDTTAPTTPGRLTYSDVTTNSVELAWGSSYDANGVKEYQVYENGVKIGAVDKPSAQITDMKAGTRYSYKVRAVDAAGNASRFTNTVYVRTKYRSGASGDCSDGEMQVEVKINTDQYGSETSWRIKNSAGSEVASGNGYDGNQSYSVKKCLPNGCYTFIISDSYNDGMCCQYGDGSYKVLVNGNEVASGAQFGSSEAKDFCSDGNTPAPTTTDRALDIYPNPARSNQVTLQLNEAESGNFMITNSFGNIVRTGNIENGSSQVDVNNLAPGIYIVKVQDGNNVTSKKLVIQ